MLYTEVQTAAILLSKNFYCGCIYFVGVHGPTVRVWRADDSIQELVLSFHHVHPGNQTQMSRQQTPLSTGPSYRLRWLTNVYEANIISVWKTGCTNLWLRRWQGRAWDACELTSALLPERVGPYLQGVCLLYGLLAASGYSAQPGTCPGWLFMAQGGIQ